MSNMDAIFSADAEQPSGPTNDELTQITTLAEQQLELELELAVLNDQVRQVTERLRAIAEKALPEAMTAIGMKKFVLVDGSTVNVKDDVAASIRSERIGAAVVWLEAQGLGDVVKDEVKVSLGKGESQYAPQILGFIEGLGFQASEKYSVHPSTLKSLVKEQLAKGVEFPEDCFSVYQYQKAEIKRPKSK